RHPAVVRRRRPRNGVARSCGGKRDNILNRLVGIALRRRRRRTSPEERHHGRRNDGQTKTFHPFLPSAPLIGSKPAVRVELIPHPSGCVRPRHPHRRGGGGCIRLPSQPTPS